MAEEEQQVEEPQTGHGIFEYQSGARYEGEWKLCEGVKKRHGRGVYTHPPPILPKPMSGVNRFKILSQSPAPSETATNRGSQARLNTAGSAVSLQSQVFVQEDEEAPALITEEYDGDWVEDTMHGYGKYTYKNEDVYEGQWENNQYHGKGTYRFKSGAVYVGDWVDHHMDGIGLFTDENGMEWSGIFINGQFDSTIQARLEQERVINQKVGAAEVLARAFLTDLVAVFEREKKAWKEGIIKSLAASTPDEALKYVTEPFTKFEERAPDKWNDLIHFIEDGEMRILRAAEESEVLGPDRITAPQLEGIGQVVELVKATEQRQAQAVFCQIDEEQWAIVQITDVINK